MMIIELKQRKEKIKFCNKIAIKQKKEEENFFINGQEWK